VYESTILPLTSPSIVSTRRSNREIHVSRLHWSKIMVNPTLTLDAEFTDHVMIARSSRRIPGIECPRSQASNRTDRPLGKHDISTVRNRLSTLFSPRLLSRSQAASTPVCASNGILHIDRTTVMRSSFVAKVTKRVHMSDAREDCMIAAFQ
jgi:hypothetical protein